MPFVVDILLKKNLFQILILTPCQDKDMKIPLPQVFIHIFIDKLEINILVLQTIKKKNWNIHVKCKY